VCVCGLLVASCAARSNTVVAPQTQKYGSGVNLGKGATIAPRAATKSAARARPASHSGQSAPTYAPVAIVQSAQQIDDDGPVGANTRLYLSRKVGKLVVEIDAVRGYEPASSALSILRTRLGQIVDKPAGIQFLPTKIIPGTEDADANHSFMENTERKYRTHHSTPNAIVLYILYADGDTGSAIGAAYSSSAYAVFKQSIESAATPLVTAEEIEDSVIVHEMGHVMALVNIGYKSPRDHEDPQHQGHSKNPKSVMYWAVDNVGVVGLLGGSTRPPTAFDADDLADLRDLRDGKLT
jgi:hypothetical protein